MLVSGVVVHDGVDDLADGQLAVDGVEEADEFLMGVLLHAATKHAPANHDPKPFVWTKPAREILAKLNRLPVPSV